MQSSERLASFGIIGDQLKAPLKVLEHHGIMVPMSYYGSLNTAPNWCDWSTLVVVIWRDDEDDGATEMLITPVSFGPKSFNKSSNERYWPRILDYVCISINLLQAFYSQRNYTFRGAKSGSNMSSFEGAT